METPDQASIERTQVGWGLWAWLVPALAAAGALSYLVGALVPLSEFTLPLAATTTFGLLAGGMQAVVLGRRIPPARWWILGSAGAGLLAGCVGLLPTAGAATSAALLAGWAYAWAVYGAVSGVILQRLLPSRRWMLASLAGWAIAGIVSGAVGWALDVFLVTPTDPSLTRLPAISRTWSTGGLAVIGAVCGGLGAAITGASLVLLSRAPVLQEDNEQRKTKDTRRVNVAGVVTGLIAAALCTYLAPLVATVLTEGSLESMDLTIFFFSVIAGTPLCVPAIAVVSIPSGIGCGYVGLELARAIGRPHSRLWIWCGAAVGGVVGCLLGSLAVFAIADVWA